MSTLRTVFLFSAFFLPLNAFAGAPLGPPTPAPIAVPPVITEPATTVGIVQTIDTTKREVVVREGDKIDQVFDITGLVLPPEVKVGSNVMVTHRPGEKKALKVEVAAAAMKLPPIRQLQASRGTRRGR